MRPDLLFAFLLLHAQAVTSIRIVELRVPGHAAAGGEALLGCQFDLEDDLLYSVKWYKDSREFYRYLPRGSTQALQFSRPGVTVDMSRSSSDVVTLVNLEPESAGVYRCEVSGEKPHFTTVADEKYINIHILPKSGPRITGLKFQYEIGDRLVANCSLPGSRPEAQLKWMMNRKPISRAYLRGPWRSVDNEALNTTSTTLGLNFMVVPLHFKKGIMEIKCQATIAPLYHREKVYVLSQPEPSPDPPLEAAEPDIPIPDFSDDPPLTEQIHEEEVHEELLHRFRELANTLHLEAPDLTPSRVNLSEGDPAVLTIGTTEIPEKVPDNSSSTEKSVVLLLVSLLMQVILL